MLLAMAQPSVFICYSCCLRYISAPLLLGLFKATIAHNIVGWKQLPVDRQPDGMCALQGPSTQLRHMSTCIATYVKRPIYLCLLLFP